MERGQKITIERNKGTENVETIEISVYEIARNIKEEQIAELLEDFGNRFFNEYHSGQRVGKLLETAHRTLQASIFRWALGLCVGLSDRTITRSDGSTFEAVDERNEMSVRCGKDIERLIEEGVLKMGWMI
jgi:hypothetical protein